MNPRLLFFEMILSVLLVVLVLCFLDPFMVLMPTGLVHGLLGALVILFVIFLGFVWKERPEDEREQLHTMIAGRIGYLVGVGVLVFGLVLETLTAHPDPWLVVALAGMVLGKLGGLMYSTWRR